MAKQWRPVVGHEDRFEVSNFGHVRSVGRRVYKRNGNGYGWRFYPSKLLKQGTNSQGYKTLNLYKDGKAYFSRVHRLVAEAFQGPIPAGYVVAHNDGDPGNNRLDNLRIDTQKSNCADKLLHGRSNRGERHPSVKLSRDQAFEVLLWAWSGTVAQKKIAETYAVSPVTVNQIKFGRVWPELDEERELLSKGGA